MQGRMTEKNKRAKERGRKITEFQRSELHCRAYKLYPPGGHLGNHLILQF